MYVYVFLFVIKWVTVAFEVIRNWVDKSYIQSLPKVKTNF